MNGQIITVTTADNLILHGINCKPDNVENDSCIIHVHGSYGNFYENFFLPAISDKCNEINVSFISINTRGHDYYSDFKSISNNQYSSKRIGGIREIFQDSYLDIDAWVKYAKSSGYTKIFLQGHSLGAMKCIYYLKKSKLNISGLILISPPDNYGLQLSDVGDKFSTDLEIAKKLSITDGDQLMPSEAYYDLISASSYFSLLGNEEDTGMFTYSNLELMRKAGMSDIKYPTVVFFASENEAIVLPVEDCINALKKSVSTENIEIVLIKGANHSYHFKEKQLASKIANWIEGILKK